MHETILSVYQHTHSTIRKNAPLMSEITQFAMDPANKSTGKYFCTGLSIEGIYLGIDFNLLHMNRFQLILTNTLAIESISCRQADFSRVLMKIMLVGEHIANLTEDVSQNDTLRIYDKGVKFGPYTDFFMADYFQTDNNHFDIEVGKAIFVVSEKPSIQERDRLQVLTSNVRFPIIDLDHLKLSDRNMHQTFEELAVAQDELCTLQL